MAKSFVCVCITLNATSPFRMNHVCFTSGDLHVRHNKSWRHFLTNMEMNSGLIIDFNNQSTNSLYLRFRSWLYPNVCNYTLKTQETTQPFVSGVYQDLTPNVTGFFALSSIISVVDILSF